MAPLRRNKRFKLFTRIMKLDFPRKMHIMLFSNYLVLKFDPTNQYSRIFASKTLWRAVAALGPTAYYHNNLSQYFIFNVMYGY